MNHTEYLAVKQNLPLEYQDVVEFGYFSGWRRGEIVSLEWRDIDRTGKVIRLRGAQSKNSQGRTLALEGPLADLMERRWRSRLVGSPLVFHRNGRPVGDWRKRWATACIKAGFFRIEPLPGKPEGRKVPSKVFHDLRRTVARNLIRSGVPERIAMSITGHKTRSVFDRYDIVNETDIRQATVRLAQHVAGQARVGGLGARHEIGSRRSSLNSDSSRTIGRSDRKPTTLQVVGKSGADDRT
jgi:integrase